MLGLPHPALWKHKGGMEFLNTMGTVEVVLCYSVLDFVDVAVANSVMDARSC